MGNVGLQSARQMGGGVSFAQSLGGVQTPTPLDMSYVPIFFSHLRATSTHPHCFTLFSPFFVPALLPYASCSPRDLRWRWHLPKGQKPSLFGALSLTCQYQAGLVRQTDPMALPMLQS